MRGVKLLLIVPLIHTMVCAQAWDTVRVMTYNLLYYGEPTSFCTESNNNVSDKDSQLKIIADHVGPDVLLVNELSASVVYADRILNTVLNTNGVNRFQRAPIQNNNSSNLVNGVYYDKTKLQLYSQEKVGKGLNNSDLVRVIDLCTFYYRDPALVTGADTVFLVLVVLHLKAGSTVADAAERASATEALMAHLHSQESRGYVVVAGDFNTGSSQEAAYQQMLSAGNDAYRFVDPLSDTVWEATQQYAYSHTQSTHASGTCHSGGGLDDRFDLILLNHEILSDTAPVRYLEASYKVIGNDGNHFDLAINDGENNSVPPDVLDALYDMSDHLPLRLDLLIKSTWPTGKKEQSFSPSLEMNFSDGGLNLRNASQGDELEVYDALGRLLHRTILNSRTARLQLDLSPGLYFVSVKNRRQNAAFKVWVH